MSEQTKRKKEEENRYANLSVTVIAYSKERDAPVKIKTPWQAFVKQACLQSNVDTICSIMGVVNGNQGDIQNILENTRKVLTSPVPSSSSSRGVRSKVGCGMSSKDDRLLLTFHWGGGIAGVVRHITFYTNGEYTYKDEISGEEFSGYAPDDIMDVVRRIVDAEDTLEEKYPDVQGRDLFGYGITLKSGKHVDLGSMMLGGETMPPWLFRDTKKLVEFIRTIRE